MPFDIDFTRKIGPLPLGAWVAIAGGAGFIFVKVLGGKKAAAAGGTSPTGAGNQFSSTSTKSGTDAEGNQFSNSYSAQGNGYLPGQLTYGASPMPFSSGDIYVNLPDSNHTNPDSSPTPPAGSRQVTLDQDSYIQTIVQKYLPVAGLGAPDNEYSKVHGPDIWSAAVESEAIIRANPQIDWSYEVPKGTKLWIPPGIGVHPAQQTVTSVTR